MKKIVNTTALNLREYPSANTAIKRVLLKGDVLEVIKYSPDWSWVNVRIGDEIGWVAHRFLLGIESKFTLDSDPECLKIALGELGTMELGDPLENTRIVEYLKTCKLDKTLANSDETAWCSAFINWCIEKAGHKGTRSARALSWRDYGTPIAEPQRGCICVFERYVKDNGKTKTYGHVGLCIGDYEKSVTIVGGNQSGKVSISAFPKNSTKYKLVACCVPPSV